MRADMWSLILHRSDSKSNSASLRRELRLVLLNLTNPIVCKWHENFGLVFNLTLAFALQSLCMEPISNFMVSTFGGNIHILNSLQLVDEWTNGMHEELLKLLCSALLGFVGMSAWCLFCDLILIAADMTEIKTQGEKSIFTVFEFIQAVRLSLFNIVILSWILAVPIVWLWQVMHVGRLQRENDPWDWRWEFPKVVVCSLTIETVFFWTHWAIHFPYLYRKIHKLHHTFTAPIAVAAVYAHPLEYLFGNLAGVILGPVLANCHPLTAYWWVTLSLVSTCGSHSGYAWHGAIGHDLHHEKFNVNFGVLKIFDYIMGTRYIDSHFYQKDLAKVAAVHDKKTE